MSVAILHDVKQRMACLLCGNSMSAFGPVFHNDENRGLTAIENVQAFVKWLGADPCSRDDLEGKRLDFLDRPDTRLLDGQGVAFAEHRDLLPELAADFPSIEIIKDPALLRQLHKESDCCQICGRSGQPGESWLELHHIIGGAGRSDERTDLIMTCRRWDRRGCHDKIEASEITLANVLWAKWHTDHKGTSWARLAVLRGSHLPEPKPLSKQEKDHASRDL